MTKLIQSDQKSMHQQKLLSFSSYSASFFQWISQISPRKQEKSLEERFEQLKEKIFERRPSLKAILALHGSLPLFEYAKLNTQISRNIPEERKQEFIDVLTGEIKRLLGEKVAESCRNQLSVHYFVDTFDHFGPIGESGLLSGHILGSLPLLNSTDTALQNVIVLACANVSFDNSSFPRGLHFHNVSQNRLLTNQVVFFGRSVDPRPVIYFRPYTIESITNAKQRLAELFAEGSINQSEVAAITKFLDDIYAKPEILASNTFAEQMTKTNFVLWQRLFEKAEQKTPNLVYLEQETIVNLLLRQYHLHQDTVIHRILFNPKYHEQIIKHFEGVTGAFSQASSSGTFLFWALPKGQKYRVQLWKQENFLVTNDRSYKVELTPENIEKALQEKELIPSLQLTFSVLCFYYGLRVLGGFSQTSYLSQMKQAFIAVTRELGNEEAAHVAEQIPTTYVSFSYPCLAYAQTSDGIRVPATTLDMMLHSSKQSFSIVDDVAKKITLREAAYRTFPNYYRYTYRYEEQNQLLLAITQEDVEKLFGIDKKITPCALISTPHA